MFSFTVSIFLDNVQVTLEEINHDNCLNINCAREKSVHVLKSYNDKAKLIVTMEQQVCR